MHDHSWTPCKGLLERGIVRHRANDQVRAGLRKVVPVSGAQIVQDDHVVAAQSPNDPRSDRARAARDEHDLAPSRRIFQRGHRSKVSSRENVSEGTPR